jgi:hypothetical protein
MISRTGGDPASTTAAARLDPFPSINRAARKNGQCKELLYSRKKEWQLPLLRVKDRKIDARGDPYAWSPTDKAPLLTRRRMPKALWDGRIFFLAETIAEFDEIIGRGANFGTWAESAHVSSGEDAPLRETPYILV